MNSLRHEEQIKIIGKEIFAYINKKNSPLNIFQLSWWNNLLLKLSSLDPKLKIQLFRFIDTLPCLQSEDIPLYLQEYLAQSKTPLAIIPEFISKMNFLHLPFEFCVKQSVALVAKSFILGSNTNEALHGIKKLAAQGYSYTLDILGELAVSEKEAEAYYQQYLSLLQRLQACNISVKLTALYSQANLLPAGYTETKAILKKSLREIYRLAKRNRSFVNVDLEHYYFKNMTFEIVKELLEEDEFINWEDAGIVCQAYLKDSKKDLLDLLAWAKNRGHKITVRLVKGAYWDYETVIAEQKGWECPVYTNKAETDANYEELTKILFQNYQYLKPAIASHNIRSIANALAIANEMDIKPAHYEFQMLYGMLDPVKEYLAAKNINIRVYSPYGELIPGMSYLVRRLLENTANESFLKQGFMDNVHEDKLLENPRVRAERQSKQKLEKAQVKPYYNFVNEANSDFSRLEARNQMLTAINDLESETKNNILSYPLLIGGQNIYSDKHSKSINPADFKHCLGEVSNADIDSCNLAIQAAKKTFKKWSELAVEKRAAVLQETAKLLRKERFKFNALLIMEAAKPWTEADAEVSEAIDFMEYYAELALKMQAEDKLRSLSGEKNDNIYTALGVSVVISPWNFPLAIMAGMTVASLVSGNTVLIKPATQTPIVAYKFIKLLHAAIQSIAGKDLLGAVNYLPGPGSVIGTHLVEHKDIKLIAFTGSSAVGMEINAKANAKQHLMKRVVSEMGGKNTIIIDNAADLDEAIPGVIYAAFAYAGQKCSACSRVVVLASVYDEFVSRLQAAASSIRPDKASSANILLSSLIDETALKKAQSYINAAKDSEAKLLVSDLAVANSGYFLSPTIFSDVNPENPLAQDEIFAPVLAVIKAQSLDHAIEIANNTCYGLTGALYSRSPENIKLVKKKFDVGNLYINRPCTAAVVSRQAFGGHKLSSIGFKAGGPNYLLQFVQEKTITENTMRRGFIE